MKKNTLFIINSDKEMGAQQSSFTAFDLHTIQLRVIFSQQGQAWGPAPVLTRHGGDIAGSRT